MVTTHTDTIGTDVPRLLEGGRGTAHDRRKRETAALWTRVSGSAREDERARLREQIVLVNMSLAHAVARRYASRGISLEDLEQVACLGLVKAVRGFDPGVGKDFVSYASPTVSGEVKRHFRDLGWMVRPPRRVQDLQARINSLVADSAPSQAAVERPADIAEALGVDQAQVVEAMTCRGAFAPMSLDAPLGESGSSSSLGDLLTSPRSDYDHVENALVLSRALASLSSRELLILQRRFWDNRTQLEIGEEVGLSQMQVSRILARILTSLREVVEGDDEELPRSA
jgi:RNA polymerase sigma-B factor